MGSIERRERERGGKRQLILDAARELFVAEGYPAVTMRKIADRIEYTPTAIYLYFKDKDELLQEICREDFLAFAEHFLRVQHIADPLEALLEMGRAYLSFAEQFPNQYRLMFMTVLPSPPQGLAEHKGNPQMDAYAMLLQTVERALAQQSLRPDLSDPELVAQLLWAGVHGVAALRIARPKDDSWVEMRPLQQLGEEMLQAQLRHIAAPGRFPRPAAKSVARARPTHPRKT